MMFKIAGIVLLAVFAILLLKSQKSEYAFLIETTASVGLLLLTLPLIGELTDELKTLLDEAKVETQFISVILKCCAIAVISRLLTELCKDAGENALQVHVELCAKIFITITAFPVFKAMISLIKAILESVT